mmetsp:Transcript_43006/g.56902  ORF Transcript_43006/g.56902 Transcript_43006/m.56902 type:complete len:97 (-) Transcript_43006:65-355(-)
MTTLDWQLTTVKTEDSNSRPSQSGRTSHQQSQHHVNQFLLAHSQKPTIECMIESKSDCLEHSEDNDTARQQTKAKTMGVLLLDSPGYDLNEAFKFD